MNRKLYRDEYHRMIGGVCAGLGEYFDVDVTIVRLIFAFAFFVGGTGLGLYVILWIVLPRKGYPFNNNPTVDYTVPPQQAEGQFTQPGNPFNNVNSTSSPFGSGPVGNMPPRPKSHAGIIAGTILIVLGGLILIDNLGIFWGFDVWNLWPVVLIALGGTLIVSGQNKRSWENFHWEHNEKRENAPNENTSSTDSHITAE